MVLIIGTGQYVYEYQEDWPRLPSGQIFQRPGGVAVDSQDRVYVYLQKGPRLMIFSRDGQFLTAWPRRSEDVQDAHHICISPNDEIYLVERDAQQVLKYNLEGELVMALGTRHQAAPQAPFNHPTDIAVSPLGEVYISDGYANSSIHRFSAEGRYIASFGSPGSGPGQLRVPHSVGVSGDGRVFVADRENNRIQVFTAEGDYIAEWTDFAKPMGLHIDSNQIAYVTDQVPRLSILNLEGELLARGRTFGLGHNVCTDSRGDVYIANWTDERVQKFVKR